MSSQPDAPNLPLPDEVCGEIGKQLQWTSYGREFAGAHRGVGRVVDEWRKLEDVLAARAAAIGIALDWSPGFESRVLGRLQLPPTTRRRPAIRRRRAPGQVSAGVVYAYRGTPSWIFVYLDVAPSHEHLQRRAGADVGGTRATAVVPHRRGDRQRRSHDPDRRSPGRGGPPHRQHARRRARGTAPARPRREQSTRPSSRSTISCVRPANRSTRPTGPSVAGSGACGGARSVGRRCSRRTT